MQTGGVGLVRALEKAFVEGGLRLPERRGVESGESGRERLRLKCSKMLKGADSAVWVPPDSGVPCTPTQTKCRNRGTGLERQRQHCQWQDPFLLGSSGISEELLQHTDRNSRRQASFKLSSRATRASGAFGGLVPVSGSVRRQPVRCMTKHSRTQGNARMGVKPLYTWSEWHLSTYDFITAARHPQAHPAGRRQPPRWCRYGSASWRQRACTTGCARMLYFVSPLRRSAA